ncbi:hypothetical protein FKX85_17265 [Echinicola soli]|uniref:Uncharacterized protein n=1 Tax=Echinicola soli TaxID=2591634 RepID=A0A514CLW9_9BACT|nr:hypothetical protein [Echinicola soli]QDH80694.1 hypothetical protein FKX85_17265 [Echinicola soli]
MDCFQSQILICQSEFIDLFLYLLDQTHLSFLVQEEITFRIDVGNSLHYHVSDEDGELSGRGTDGQNPPFSKAYPMKEVS